MRFAMTRANIGLLPLAIHSASALRRPVLLASTGGSGISPPPSAASNPAFTSSPPASGLPKPELSAVGLQVGEAGVVVFEEDAVVDGRREDGLHAVEIALRDWVELMIVAARAADGQAHEDLRRGVDIIGEFLHDVLLFHLEEHVPIGADPVVARAHAGRGFVRIELVGCNLLFGETVIGLVVVEGLDDIVAIAPGFT